MKHESRHTSDQEVKTNKNEIIKKCVLTVVLLALSAFMIVNRAYLTNRVTNKLYPADGTEKHRISLLGDHEIAQPFVAETNSIGTVGVRFNNNEKNSASGTVRIELIDSEGNMVSNTEIDASHIRESGVTKFILGGDSETINEFHTVNGSGKGQRVATIFIDKGESYTFRIIAADVVSDGRIDLDMYSYDTRNDDKPDHIIVDGEVVSGASLAMYTKNDVYSRGTIIMFIVLVLASLIFVWLPLRRIDDGAARLLRNDSFVLSTWLSRLFFLAAPMAAYFMIQKYVDYDITKFMRHLTNDSIKWLLNLIIIGLVWWFIYTITNSTRVTAMLTVLVGSAFGFVNYMLVMFRGSPLMFSDLVQLGTALQVADAYTITFRKYLMWAILLTVLWCVVCLALPAHKGLSGRKRLIPVAALVVWAGVFYWSIFVSSVIEDHDFKVSSFKPTVSYYRNGCALSFMVTVKNAIVRAPEGYDAKEIETLAADYPSDKAVPSDKVSPETPNVIIVMNESFSDLMVLGDISTNEDSIPFYRSISDGAIKGWMYSSVFGGSTANSEFECLTGFTTEFLPFQSVPFRSVIREETPSLADYMKSMGYGGNIAFHPGLQNSYNRNVVYPLLGFDEHVAKEDLDDPDKVRDFVSDAYDYEYVENRYESFRDEDPDSPFWMFNVTIQNHGGYTHVAGIVDAGIEVLSVDAQYEAVGQFLNLMKLSDEALEGLINYYDSIDEPTVIVLFGDHQPKLEDDFYSNMKENYHPDDSDLEWSELQHKVPFMIWANYDIDGGDETLHLSANYIAAYLKQLLGMPMTGFDKYLMDMYQELPVINAICYEDAAGNIYDPDKPSDFDERLNQYEKIQYNGLIDHRNRVDGFFNLKPAD